jgi:hypothetical protein
MKKKFTVFCLYLLLVSEVTSTQAQGFVKSSLPKELTNTAIVHKIEVTFANGSLLLFDLSKTNIAVGKFKSTPIKQDVATIKKVKENVFAPDIAGGIWNLIFRDGGEFSSKKLNTSGEENTFIEFDMKRKGEIVGTISAVVYHRYSGTVRQRQNPKSSSIQISNYKDTIAVRGIILLLPHQDTVRFESLSINGDLPLYEGKIGFKEKICIIEREEPGSTFKIIDNGKCIGGIQSSPFGQELLLLQEMDDPLQIGLICVSALQIMASQIASSHIIK